MTTSYSAKLLRSLERFLLPNACVGCGALVEAHSPDELVCSLCRWRMKPLVGGCPRCRQPLPPVGPCRFCAPWPTELRWVRSAVWLETEARAVVHHLKYRGYPSLARFAAGLMARYIASPAAGLLVPVPLTRARERRRGYNQAALLARRLGWLWRLPVDETVLARVREAGSQTALTPEERRANIKGCFKASGPASGAEMVTIVDDVLTTGATLGAASAALVDAGWEQIEAVTFARTPPFEYRIEQRSKDQGATR